eukprot:m.200598 g.200598  ORF g.200598 m.200598 type:complete len:85 (+) comp13711_c0_seq8:65-319(+)
MCNPYHSELKQCSVSAENSTNTISFTQASNNGDIMLLSFYEFIVVDINHSAGYETLLAVVSFRLFIFIGRFFQCCDVIQVVIRK